MSRIIDTESIGKDRQKLSKQIMIALKQLMSTPEPDDTSRDMAAFIALSLKQIYDNIDPSVEAWEKRGYWLKADRFRMDWLWTAKYAREVEEALLSDDWQRMAFALITVADKLKTVKIPVRLTAEQFWAGSYQKLKEASK